MAHDAEVGEFYVHALVHAEHLGKPREIVTLGVQSVAYARVSSYATSGSRLFHHIANNDQSLVAEDLTEEVDVLGGVCRAQMFAVVEYLPAVRSICLREFSFYYLCRLVVERAALCYLADVCLAQPYRLDMAFTAWLGRRRSRFGGLALHVHTLLRQIVFGHYSLGLPHCSSRECNHTVCVYISFSSCRHLAEAESAATEARVYHTSTQRNAEEHVAADVLHYILTLTVCHGLLHHFHAFVHSIARLLDVIIIITKGQQP